MSLTKINYIAWSLILIPCLQFAYNIIHYVNLGAPVSAIIVPAVSGFVTNFLLFFFLGRFIVQTAINKRILRRLDELNRASAPPGYPETLEELDSQPGARSGDS